MVIRSMRRVVQILNFLQVRVPKPPPSYSEAVESGASSSARTPSGSSDGEEQLPIRVKSEASPDGVRFEINPLPDGVLVSINPPKAPYKAIKHSPCDIVLVIDVSGSMGEDAPIPTEDPKERKRNGLTILDLTKHAARTIIGSLNENDRLGVITFSDRAEVILNLTPMTARNKEMAWERVDKLKPQDLTNLWHGIRDAIEMLEGKHRQESVTAIMVLTDGQPNTMFVSFDTIEDYQLIKIRCPQQGYVPKLRTYEMYASMHTFGFGYRIRSGLLNSIAEVGGGNYAFIPDAGMIVSTVLLRYDSSSNLECLGHGICPCDRQPPINIRKVGKIDHQSPRRTHIRGDRRRLHTEGEARSIRAKKQTEDTSRQSAVRAVARYIS